MTGYTTGDTAVALAEVAGDGVLLSADPILLALNSRAGGVIGAPIAVPQLAMISRLARRLGIAVSRSVVIADDDVDLDLWVRAQPEGDTVGLAVSGWRELQPWRPAAPNPGAGVDFLSSGADWRWETDAALRLTFVSPDAGPRMGVDPLGGAGRLGFGKRRGRLQGGRRVFAAPGLSGASGATLRPRAAVAATWSAQCARVFLSDFPPVGGK